MIRRRLVLIPPRAAREIRTPRAFSILELLVVLALLIALAALVFPNMQAFLGPQRVESAATEIENAIVLTRSDAIREGRVRLIALVRTQEETTIVSAAVQPALALSLLRTDEEPAPLSMRTAGVLSNSLTVGLQPAEDALADAEVDPVEPPSTTTPTREPSPPARTVLALCFADGTVLADRPIHVLDATGAGVLLSINRWTGAVGRTVVSPAALNASGEDPPDGDDASPQDAAPGEPFSPSTMPGEAAAGTPAGKASSRPRRGRPGRSARLATRALRASVLLETLAAVAIFVVAGVAVLGAMDRAIAAEERAKRRDQAMDLARSTLSMIEAGVLSVESIDGPVRGWSGPAGAGEGESRGGPFLGEAVAPAAGGMFSDDLPEASGWELSVKTAPAAFAGLTSVEVSAVLVVGGNEVERVALHQLVRLGERAGDRPGATDETFGRAIQNPRGAVARERSGGRSPAGGEP